jgi:hypothetical protein
MTVTDISCQMINVTENTKVNCDRPALGLPPPGHRAYRAYREGKKLNLNSLYFSVPLRAAAVLRDVQRVATEEARPAVHLPQSDSTAGTEEPGRSVGAAI